VIDARLETILQRIALLAAVDDDRQVFGADTHDYALAKPLTGDELGDLERALGVALPDEVRAFLRRAGACGAGPYHGLLPLLAVDRDAIRIADQGCGMSSLLVVAGDAKGEVWTDMGDDQRAPEARSLLAWYEAWLDRAMIAWAVHAAPRLALDGADRPDELEAAMVAFDLLEALPERTSEQERALGYLHLRERRASDADAAFVRASKAPEPHTQLLASERDARLYRDRANIAYVLDDHATALEHARAGLAIPNIWFSTNDELREILERALHASGDADAALDVLEQRACEAFFDFGLHHRLATEHLARGNLEAATVALERAANMPNIAGQGASYDDRVDGAFQPIIDALRTAGRTREADALATHADLLVNGN
jgi:hypothetical protein